MPNMPIVTYSLNSLYDKVTIGLFKPGEQAFISPLVGHAPIGIYCYFLIKVHKMSCMSTYWKRKKKDIVKLGWLYQF